jgi:plastocyanin
MRRVLVVAVLGVVAVGCGDHDNTTAPRVDADEFEPVAEVTVDEDGFDPELLEVTAGDTVTLVNAGDEPHTFTTTDGFDTGVLQPGDEVALRLEDVGAVSYQDDRDPDHRGVIVVEPPG